MLEFYIIADNKPKPHDPGEMNLEFAGGLEDKVFNNLQKKGIIDKRFDYYSDFRWGSDIIRQIRQTISNKKIESDTDVRKLIGLLDTAQDNDCGLIAYGD